jgi:hypothetical protein
MLTNDPRSWCTEINTIEPELRYHKTYIRTGL